MTASKSTRNLQGKKWEKERRERLNESFNALGKLLPCYEPSVNISKIDILIKSAAYIARLKSDANVLKHSSNVNEATRRDCAEIKELHEKVAHLTTRNEQLSNLLKDANITIPTEVGGPIREKAKKWSGKIGVEKAEEFKKSEAQKENKEKVINNQKKSKPKLPGKAKPLKLEEKKKKVRRKPKISKDINNITSISSAATLTITNVQPIQPYYIIANNIASTITTQATTVKNVITTPILSTTNCQTNKTFSNIILPIVQPQTLLNPPLLLNTATQSNTVYVLKANKADQQLPGLIPIDSDVSTLKTSSTPKETPKTLKKLAVIKPKRRVFTRIGNKLPIPPSKFDSSSLIVWSGAGMSPVSVKKRQKVIKRKRKTLDNSDKPSKDIENLGKSLKNTKKLTDIVLTSQQEISKTIVNNRQNSDYSIDTICKESESPMSKEIESVINEVVEKAKDISVISDSTSKTNECQTIQPESQMNVSPAKDNLKVLSSISQNSLVLSSVNQKAQETQKHFQTEEKILPNLAQTQTCKIQNGGLNKQQPQNQILSQPNQFHIQNASSSQMLNIKPDVIVKPLEQPSQTHQNQFIKHQTSNSIRTQTQIQQQSSQILHVQTHQPPEELNLHSELSNDIFASLQVQGSQNPESTSPTAAFLNAFPLVSSFTGVKVTEVLEEETTDSPHGTPTLLQIGNMEAHNQKTTHTNADNLTPNMINLDNFNFFNNNLYNSFDSIMVTTPNIPATTTQPILTNVMSMTVANGSGSGSGGKEPKVVDKMATVGGPQREKVLYDGNCPNTNIPNAIKHYRNGTINAKKQVKTSTSTQNTQEKPFYNSLASSVISAPSTIPQPTQTQPFCDQVANTTRAVVSSGINFNSANRYNEYNTFNPFELPKTTQSFGVKSYESYSNNCNYNYQPTDYNYQLKNNYNYDVNVNNCNFYNSTSTNTAPNTTNHNLSQPLTQSQNTTNTNQSTQPISNNTSNKFKKTKEQSNKQMVNWMAPDFCGSGSTSTVAKVTSYSDIGQLGQNSYLYSNDYPNTGNVVGVPMEHQTQEHQFPWSPTKLPQLLDTPQHSFPPSTLPTLVGDLALGIGSYSSTNVHVFDKSLQSKQKTKKPNQTYEPGNILSVSQLVDHNKDTVTPTPPARVANRRNSGNRSHKTQANTKNTAKRHKDKEKTKVCASDEWESSPTKRSKNQISYSAESLIAAKSQQNYPKTIPPYLPDNILPYFPHNIDENFTHAQGNQSYQNNAFTGNYNNSFIPSSTSTTYLPTSNFIPDMFDNPVENIFSHVNTTKMSNSHMVNAANAHKVKVSPQKTKDVYAVPAAPSVPTSNAGGCLANGGTNLGNVVLTPSKGKRKKETFVDLSFLSMPSINSPLLPEDFHGGFLPPPPNPNQLYSSCKNPIYKQGGGELGSLPIGPLGTSTAGVTPTAPGVISGVISGSRAIQHPEISPAPGSLTNFNLCTIFPEINRTNSVVPDVFRNYGNSSNSVQKSSNFLPNLE